MAGEYWPNPLTCGVPWGQVQLYPPYPPALPVQPMTRIDTYTLPSPANDPALEKRIAKLERQVRMLRRDRIRRARKGR